jgi:hypothetical protein
MKLNTPLVTLLAGLVLGVGVLVTSAVWTSGSSAATSAGNPYGATSSPAATTAAPAVSASSSPATAPTTAPATTATTSPAPTTAATTAPAQATAPAQSTGPAATSSGTQKDVPPKADYVGTVNGGGAAVAISVSGTKAVAYLCNGGAVASWLRGSVSDGMLKLTGKNGSHLSLDYRKADAAGSITADGNHYMFSAPLVHRVSSLHRQPGLYEATALVHGVMIKAGWIVLQNGSQIGSVEYDPDSAIPPTAEAPVLNLATGTAQYDGVTLVASLISGISGSGF